MKRFGILNVILFLLVALAAWRTIDVWRRGVPERELPADPASRAPGDAPLPVVRKPAVPPMVAAIADKDLFHSSRKAAALAAPVTAPTPAPPPPTLKLSGVIVVGKQREVLLLDSAQANRQLRMREGEEIAGFKVGKIEAEQVSLLGGAGEEIVLPLQIEKAKGAKKGGFGPAKAGGQCGSTGQGRRAPPATGRGAGGPATRGGGRAAGRKRRPRRSGDGCATTGRECPRTTEAVARGGRGTMRLELENGVSRAGARGARTRRAPISTSRRSRLGPFAAVSAPPCGWRRFPARSGGWSARGLEWV